MRLTCLLVASRGCSALHCTATPPHTTPHHTLYATPLHHHTHTQAPCILFIDEFDGLGKARTYGGGGGNDESVHTINQLLTGGVAGGGGWRGGGFSGVPER